MTGRRSFRPPGNRVTVRRRWEIGFPLIVVGILMAWTVADVRGGQVIFWIGVLLAAVGAVVFFSGWIKR